MLRLPLIKWGVRIAAGAALVFILVSAAQAFDTPSAAFDALWRAGRDWLTGANPYRDGDAVSAQQGDDPVMQWSPNWAPLAMALGALPKPIAFLVWTLINVSAIAAGCALSAQTARRLSAKNKNRPDAFTLSCGLFAIVAMMGASHHALLFGGPGLLVFFGFSLTISALVSRRDAAASAGLAIVLLNPATGLLVSLALAPSRRGRRILRGGLVGLLLLSTPAFIVASAPELAQNFFESYRSGNESNNGVVASAAMVAELFGYAPPAFGSGFYLASALFFLAGLGVAIARAGGNLSALERLLIAAPFAAAAAPSVYGDTVIVAAAIIFAALAPRAKAFLFALGFALAWRPVPLFSVASTIPGSVALGLLLVFTASVWIIVVRGSPKIDGLASPARSAR